jgi:hypothetical protein
MTPQDPCPPRTARHLIAAAIAAAGGLQATARRFGLTHQAISGWKSRGFVPLEHVHELCAFAGHVVRPHDLVDAMASERRARRVSPRRPAVAEVGA